MFTKKPTSLEPQRVGIYLTSQEAARKLSVSLKTFMRMAKDYNLEPAFNAPGRRGKSPRWSNEKLDQWIEGTLAEKLTQASWLRFRDAELEKRPPRLTRDCNREPYEK